MEFRHELLGCFVSGPSVFYDDNQNKKDLAAEQGKLFRTYVWGDKGICHTLQKLKNETYGKDLMLILFQFYVNPLSIELQHLKEIENYRKKEKSIGIPIIVTDDNFFNQSEEGRYNFLKQSILKKLDLLVVVVKRRKLDTNMDLLQSDLLKGLV